MRANLGDRMEDNKGNVTWLNNIVPHRCHTCNYEWIAPNIKEGVKCPKCSSNLVELIINGKHIGPVRI